MEAFGGLFIIVLLLAGLLFGGKKKAEPDPDATTFGSASWLGIVEALLKGMFKRTGILVGDWVGLLGTYYDDTHALTIGPSGSGKGTAAILPNLLNARFAFCIDPGGENTAIAIKAWDDAGYEVSVINPMGILTDEPWALPQDGFDIFEFLDPDDPQFAALAEMFADLLTPRTGGEQGSSQFFKDTGQSWKQANMMHIRTALPAEEQHLGTMYRHANLPADQWEALLEAMKANPAADGLIAAEASAMERREAQAPEEFSAIMSTVQQDLRWLADPLIRKSLTQRDVDFGALKGVNREGRPVKGCIIMVVLPLEYVETHAAISRLALGSAIWAMQRQPLAREKVLFIIDEAAALQKLKRLPNWLATLRKYRAVLWPIFQNIGQIKALYGADWQSFIANCGLRQFLGAADLETAEYVHKLLGEQTTYTTSINPEGEESHAQTRRALMTVDEVLYFDRDRQIVFNGNHKPMNLIKTRYWERPELRGRYNQNPYIKDSTPRVLNTPFRKMTGDIAYAFAWAFAPHSGAGVLWLSVVGGISLWAFF